MPTSGAPLFLARRSYRRRRMMDGARMLPLLGAVLFLLPALWSPAESPAPDTGRGGIYLFVVWAGLVAAALGLARGLAPALDEEDKAEGAPEILLASALDAGGAGAFASAAADLDAAIDAATGAALARARADAQRGFERAAGTCDAPPDPSDPPSDPRQEH